MGNKNEIIRRALNHHGIVVTTNIPEHIIDQLRLNGYKIRKSRKWQKGKRSVLKEESLSTEQSTVTSDTGVGAMNVNSL